MIDTHFNEPKFFTEEKIREFDESLQDSIEAIANFPASNFGLIMKEVYQAFSRSVVARLERENSIKYLQMLNNIGQANFKFGVLIDEEFEVSIFGNSFKLIGESTTAYMDTDTWMDAFFAAVIIRDMQGIEFLVSVPEKIHQEANLKPSEFDLKFVGFLKGLFDQEANIAQLLVDAMEASDPEKLEKNTVNYATKILLPQLSLYKNFLSEEQSLFNENLEKALLKHKDFWTKGKMYLDERGWISLPLLAACTIAVDNKNFDIEITSGYIPSWLYKGEFLN